MLHEVLLVGHALAGAVALVAGVIAFERPPRAALTHLVSSGVMLVLLGGAVASTWPELARPTRLLFLALGVLGLAVVGQAARAWRRRPVSHHPARRAYREPLAFTCVALTDAFTVVLVLDLGAPGWLVAATGIVVAVVGHRLVRRRLAVLHPGAANSPAAAISSN